MTRIRIITMALAAVFCLSAITASGAFAAKKGEIVNGSGNAPVKTKFSGSSSVPGLLETVAGSKIECAAATVTGTIASKTTGNATFSFTTCKNASGNCKTSGAAAGEIVIAVTLLGKVVGEKDLILNTTTQKEIVCGTVKIQVKGSVLVKVNSEGVLSTKNSFEAKGKAGVQEPENNTLQAEFPGKGFENASLNATGLNVTFEEQVEAI